MVISTSIHHYVYIRRDITINPSSIELSLLKIHTCVFNVYTNLVKEIHFSMNERAVWLVSPEDRTVSYSLPAASSRCTWSWLSSASFRYWWSVFAPSGTTAVSTTCRITTVKNGWVHRSRELVNFVMRVIFSCDTVRDTNTGVCFTD